MKAPTTRAGRRVYRGAPRPLAVGACPHCARPIPLNSRGRRRFHIDPETKVRCTGTGIQVGERDFHLTELPLVMLPAEHAGRSPVSTSVRTSVRAESRTRVRASDGTSLDYAGGSDRNVKHGRVECDGCGRHLPLNGDGTPRRHRIRHQDPLAPYCEGAS